MIPVVVDSNVYVSALVFGGIPAAVLRLAEAGAFHLVVSENIKEEVTEALTLKFGWPERRVKEAAERLWQSAELIHPVLSIRVARDPDDDHILECAIESHAHVIVTGDNDLLALHPFRGLEILNPATFLSRHFGRRPGSDH